MKPMQKFIHPLQPLDVAFMARLNIYYEHEAGQWLIAHRGSRNHHTQNQQTCGNAALIQTCIKGFAKTGI